MKTYEIPTPSGTKTVQANTKQAALGMLAVPDSNPISVKSVSNPEKPYDIKTTTPTATTSGLSMTTDGISSQMQTDSTATPPVNPQKDSLAGILDNITGDINNSAARENNIRDESKIYEKKQKATAVSNQLDKMDKNYRDQVTEIKKNTQGLFGGAVDQKVSELTSVYENDRANVALTYKVLAGDYNDTLQIVNDKISSIEKQNQQKIEAYKLAADAVNNDLTEKEKLVVQANLTKKENDAKMIRDSYSEILKNAVANGASASVLSSIDAAARAPGATAASIAVAAGAYGAKRDLQFVPGTENQQGGVFDPATGSFTPLGGGTASSDVVVTDSSGKTVTVPANTYNERSDTLNLVNTALNDPNLRYAVGLQTWNPLNLIPGNAAQNVKAIISQVEAKLALDNRAKLKGSGAISDFESKTLQRAASSFNRSLPLTDAQKQLKQIKGVLTTLNGGQAQVIVKNPINGETGTAYADTAAINKMIQDGLVVEYQ